MLYFKCYSRKYFPDDRLMAQFKKPSGNLQHKKLGNRQYKTTELLNNTV